jgi:hypothetical protein
VTRSDVCGQPTASVSPHAAALRPWYFLSLSSDQRRSLCVGRVCNRELARTSFRHKPSCDHRSKSSPLEKNRCVPRPRNQARKQYDRVRAFFPFQAPVFVHIWTPEAARTRVNARLNSAETGERTMRTRRITAARGQTILSKISSFFTAREKPINL